MLVHFVLFKQLLRTQKAASGKFAALSAFILFCPWNTAVMLVSCTKVAFFFLLSNHIYILKEAENRDGAHAAQIEIKTTEVYIYIGIYMVGSVSAHIIPCKLGYMLNIYADDAPAAVCACVKDNKFKFQVFAGFFLRCCGVQKMSHTNHGFYFVYKGTARGNTLQLGIFLLL